MKKGLAKNFQPLRAKRAAKANIGGHKRKLVISPFCKLPHNSTTTRTANVNRNTPHKPNAVIKLQTGQAPSRLPGVQGGGQPPCSILSSLTTTAHLSSLFSLIKQASTRLFFLFFLFIRYRSQKNEKIYCNNGQIIV